MIIIYQIFLIQKKSKYSDHIELNNHFKNITEKHIGLLIGKNGKHFISITQKINLNIFGILKMITRLDYGEITNKTLKTLKMKLLKESAIF